MKTKLEALLDIRNTLRDPKNWTTGFFARDKEGHGTQPYDPEAVCWCLEGAMKKAVYETEDGIGEVSKYSLYIKVKYTLKNHIPKNNLILASFNDDAVTKHEDVLAIIDQAIFNTIKETL